MTVLTKSRRIVIFRHFTVRYNAHIILILLIQFSWFAIRRSTIVLDRLPYSSIFTIHVNCNKYRIEYFTHKRNTLITTFTVCIYI